MATRTIKTNDGQEYSGGLSDFSEYDDYIEHKGFFTTTKIYKRAIIRDASTSGMSDILAAMVALIIMLLIAIVILAPVTSEENKATSAKHFSTH